MLQRAAQEGKMGIIRAAMEAVSGGLADQWLEVYSNFLTHTL